MLVSFHEAMNRLYAGVWQSFADKSYIPSIHISWHLKGSTLMYRIPSGIEVPSRNTIDTWQGSKHFIQLT